LPLVFNPRRKPWIQLEHSDPATITAQVERCPSGALSWAKDEDL
jgi:putative redox protein